MSICRHRIFVVALSAILLTYPGKSMLADGNGEDTRRVILAMFTAFNKHDIDAIVDLYSVDAFILSPGDVEPRIGKEVVRNIYADHFDNIPNVHDAVQNLVIEGERGAVEFIATWDQTSKNDSKARGKLRIAAFLTVKNGQIVKDVTYFDRVELSENMNIGAEH